jgi:hypothetical protein
MSLSTGKTSVRVEIDLCLATDAMQVAEKNQASECTAANRQNTGQPRDALMTRYANLNEEVG